MQHVARARLRRVLLWAKVLLAPGQADEAAADHRACLEDFRRAGRATDRLLTIVMFHGLRAAATWATTPGDRPAVTEARDQLAALGSSEVSWARCAVALLADSAGDTATGSFVVRVQVPDVSNNLNFAFLSPAPGAGGLSGLPAGAVIVTVGGVLRW